MREESGNRIRKEKAKRKEVKNWGEEGEGNRHDCQLIMGDQMNSEDSERERER